MFKNKIECFFQFTEWAYLVSFRDSLHQGVLRDIEMRQKRKIENILFLEKQKDLTKKYKEHEEVRARENI